MFGVPSQCSICGVPGVTRGLPSYNDVCTDKEDCRDRAILRERRKTTDLEKRVKELEALVKKEQPSAAI
jgi:hypothetical protein